jgi:hypothetical protein
MHQERCTSYIPVHHALANGALSWNGFAMLPIENRTHSPHDPYELGRIIGPHGAATYPCCRSIVRNFSFRMLSSIAGFVLTW